MVSAAYTSLVQLRQRPAAPRASRSEVGTRPRLEGPPASLLTKRLSRACPAPPLDEVRDARLPRPQRAPHRQRWVARCRSRPLLVVLAWVKPFQRLPWRNLSQTKRRAAPRPTTRYEALPPNYPSIRLLRKRLRMRAVNEPGIPTPAFRPGRKVSPHVPAGQSISTRSC